MAKKAAKRKGAKKPVAKKPVAKKPVSRKIKKIRTQLGDVLEGLKGNRSPKAKGLRRTITKLMADSDCGPTLFDF